MNTLELSNDLALAAWELAEAETMERAAAVLRKNAARRLGTVHMEFRAALAAALDQRAKAKKGRQTERTGGTAA